MYKLYTKTKGVSKKYVRKLLLIMRLTTVILIASILQASASSYAQKITYVKKDVSLMKLFSEISKQTGYDVTGYTGALSATTLIDVDFKNTPIEAALNTALKGLPLTYEIKDKIITIKEKTETFLDRLGGLFSMINVRGRVLDENGKGLVGAVVKVKNTPKTTRTDENGAFSLSNVDEKAVLIISYLGYDSQEVKVSENIGTITMALSSGKLDEVEINAGYYTVKESERTGSISRITAETIAKQPVSNPLAALIGRMPGVDIREQTGMPGGNFSVRVRGQNSFRTGTGNNDGNEPLYLIDGVPIVSSSLYSNAVIQPYLNGMSALASINPLDIESIEVLKDGDATAIYGSRGANGVILITTKKGKAGATNVEFNLSQGGGKVPQKIDLLNTEQYLSMRKEAYANDKLNPSIRNGPDLLNWDQAKYTDWQKLFIGGTANYTNLQGSMSGGNSSTQFLIRGGLFKQGTVLPDDGKYMKGSGLVNINHISNNQKLKANFSINYLSDKNNTNNKDFTSTALTLAPNAPEIYDAAGNLNWQNSTWSNPFADLRRRYQANTDNLITNGELGYKILKDLEIKSTFGYTRINFNELSTSPISATNPASLSTGNIITADNKVNTWIVEPQLNYSKSTGNSRFNIILGATFQSKKQQAQTLSVGGYTSDALLGNLLAGTTSSILATNYSEYRYQAFFGRINYNLNEKYILNLTGRRDGSSRFGQDKQFANFGAIGAAWLFKEESFLRNKKVLSSGKLRASYGITGSDQIPDYGYLDTYSPTTYPYQGTGGLVPTRLANRDYSWETNKKFEAALELGFLKDRILFNVAGYRNRSSSQLVGYTLSTVTGFQTIQFNLPATIQNTGVEFELNTVNFAGDKFKWSSSLNLSIPKSKLVSYPNIAGSAYADRYKVGESLNLAKTYRFTGVDPISGLYTVEDVGSNGVLSTSEDGQFIKELGQKFFGGVANNFSYKGFEIDFFVQLVKKTAIDTYFFNYPGALSNQPVKVLDRWSPTNNSSSIQRFGIGLGPILAYNNFYQSDAGIVDASFIKLRNVSISYNFNNRIVNALKMKALKISLQGQNLLTITNYSWDPEIANINVMPALRILTAGIQATF